MQLMLARVARLAALRAWQTGAVSSNDTGARRRAQLAAARLYVVCPAEDSSGAAAPAASERLPELLRAAIAGGVDVVQIREKLLADDQLVAVVHAVRALCERLGALLIVNDRPGVALEARADGVHVGQDDISPAAVRELVGDEMLVGLSTHSEEEIDAVDPQLVDYIGVGPVHETPTKPGRPAVGAGLVRYAAAHARVPFFAIGGLHAGNLREVIDAGATRACVLRAVTDARDPQAAAAELRGMLDEVPLER
jgi:thiamine-phosphate pyrophosphorylase